MCRYLVVVDGVGFLGCQGLSEFRCQAIMYN